MKRNAFYFSTSVVTMFFATCCPAQSNVVFYGVNTNAIAVSFADTNLSLSAQTAIVADLQLCLQHWGQKSELCLRNKGNSAGYLDNPNRNPYYPETIVFPENVVSNGTSELALQIPKSLSDTYTNAFAFAAANSNLVAAAYEFVQFVSSTNFCSITSNQISNYVLYSHATPELYQVSFPDITNSLRKQTFHLPSVLGFYYSSKGPAATNLWVGIPSCSPLGYIDSLGWDFFPSIWHDGKWKFCIWDGVP
jgi:hypothetical protein